MSTGSAFVYRDFQLLWSHRSFTEEKKSLMRFIENSECVRLNQGLNELFFELIDRAVKEKRNDPFIYEGLYKLAQKHARQTHNVFSKRVWDKRAEFRAKKIINLLPDGFKPSSLLDVGCSEGSITAAMVSLLHIQGDKAHGVDINESISDTVDQERSGSQFQFVLLNPSDKFTLPFPNESKSFVTCLMSLHHMESPEDMLSEVYRVMEPGGVLVVREHDAFELGRSGSEEQDYPRENRFNRFLGLVHGLYAVVLSQPREVASGEAFCQEYFANYRSKRQWKKAIQGRGFKEHYTDEYIAQDNLLRQYWTVYVKEDEGVKSYTNSSPAQYRPGSSSQLNANSSTCSRKRSLPEDSDEERRNRAERFGMEKELSAKHVRKRAFGHHSSSLFDKVPLYNSTEEEHQRKQMRRKRFQSPLR